MFGRLQLFHRIFLHGILLIIALAGAVILAVHLLEEKPVHWDDAFSRSAMLMADTIEAPESENRELKRQLNTMHHVTQASVAVYTHDGTLVAQAGEEALPPLNSIQLNKLRSSKNTFHRRMGEIGVLIPSKAHPAYLLIDWHRGDHLSWRFGAVLIVALLVIGAMSFPLARSIAKPIDVITTTAKKLKEGDLSARVEMTKNREFTVLATTLNEMASGLESHIRREKELLANVSHELRTPLSRIRVALEIVAESNQEPKRVKSHIDGIASDLQELEQLVTDVLDATRLALKGDDGGITIQKQEVDLSVFLSEAADDFRNKHSRKIRLVMPDDPPIVSLDIALFRRVLNNLMENAAKYSKADTELTVNMRTEGSSYIFEVKDRGIGVSDEDLPRIFEPFFRADKSRAKKIPGVGLGLTLSKRIICAHGGEIVAVPRSEGGLTIRILLPMDATS